MLRNPLTNEPVAIAGALRAVLHALVLLGIIALDAEQLAAVSIAVEFVLTLVLRSAVTSPEGAAQIAAEAYEAGRRDA